MPGSRAHRWCRLVSSGPTRAQHLVVVGRVCGAFGVRGWLRVRSYTRPAENILAYSPWYLRREASDDAANDADEAHRVVAGEARADGVVAQIDGVADRDAAAALAGARVMVPRSSFPAVGAREFYWADLEGLKVTNLEGVELGAISHLFETGANDVMVVTDGERERLIPFTKDAVKKVDLESRMMQVDWDPEF